MSRKPPKDAIEPRVRGMRPSATVAIHEHSNALLADGRTVYDLGLGESPFPVPTTVVDALRANAKEKSYLPVRGLHPLRRAVAHYTERKAGIDRTAEDVLVGPGAKQLVYLLQLVFRGELVVPAPSWGPYAAQAQILGRELRIIQTRREDGWLLTPESLEVACSLGENVLRLVVLGYPSNPSGTTYKVDQLKALAKVARRHRVLLLADEIYGELHHKGQHVSIARYYPEGTIISTGLSKWCGAGGWRLGTMIFPEDLRWLLDAMATVATVTFTSTSAPIQHAAITAFGGGEQIESYLTSSRRVLSALGRWCARKLRAAGLECAQPVGGFYVFPDFGPLKERLEGRGITNGRELCARLLADTGVAILPGSDFGRPNEELTARLAYVDFDGERALEAVAVIPTEQPLDETFLKRHCRPVYSAIRALCDWVEA